MIAVSRLHHDRRADLRAASQASSASVTGRPSGTGTPTPQEGAGQVFVLGDRLGDGAGAVGLGRQDAPLLGPVAQLNQAAVIEPPDRDIARLGRGHDRRRARAQVGDMPDVASLRRVAATS